MTQPDRSIEAGDYRLSFPGDADWEFYQYFIFRIPWMPAYWHENNESNDLMRIGASECLTIYNDDNSGVCTLAKTWDLCGAKQQDRLSISGSTTATSAWTEGVSATELDGYVSPGKHFSFNKFPTGQSFEKPQYVVCRVKIEADSDDADDDLAMHAVAFSTFCDLDYDEGPEECAEDVMIIDRTTNMLYSPDNFCSSWHIMNAMCDTLRRMLYENRPAICVPLWGTAYLIVP
jgi:hypothetical protein